MGSVEFESPNRKHDVQTIVSCYLEDSFSSLGDCCNLTEQDVKLIYKKFSEVTRYYESAQVIDIATADSEGILFHQNFSFKVFFSCLKLIFIILLPTIIY